MKLMVVSGRSGSGKSVALRVLEDLGYYCVDNIPVNLLPALTHTVINDYENVAVSLDVRNLPDDPSDISEILDYLPNAVELDILYLDADDYLEGYARPNAADGSTATDGSACEFSAWKLI